MLINSIIAYIMLGFAILGAADRIAGNRFGLGEKFEQAFVSMGPLVLSMVGMLVLAPVIADVLSPVLTPLFTLISADPSIFAGIILGTDMGGAPLAREMALNPQAGQLSGIIISSMLGATIIFHIPVSMEIAGQDSSYIAKGMIAGLITIPVGCLVGGLTAGFSLSLIIPNIVPVVVIAVLLAAGMWKCSRILVRGFVILGKIILAIATIGLVLGIWEMMTGVKLVQGTAPAAEAFGVVATVAVFLAGAFPMMHIVVRILDKPLKVIGRKLSINDVSAAGPILTMANSIPMLESMKRMDPRGKIINAAFCVSGAFVLGDHLGYVASYDPEMLIPMILCKLSAGAAAILLALYMTRTGFEK